MEQDQTNPPEAKQMTDSGTENQQVVIQQAIMQPQIVIPQTQSESCQHPPKIEQQKERQEPAELPAIDTHDRKQIQDSWQQGQRPDPQSRLDQQPQQVSECQDGGFSNQREAPAALEEEIKREEPKKIQEDHKEEAQKNDGDHDDEDKDDDSAEENNLDEEEEEEEEGATDSDNDRLIDDDDGGADGNSELQGRNLTEEKNQVPVKKEEQREINQQGAEPRLHILQPSQRSQAQMQSLQPQYPQQQQQPSTHSPLEQEMHLKMLMDSTSGIQFSQLMQQLQQQRHQDQALGQPLHQQPQNLPQAQQVPQLQQVSQLQQVPQLQQLAEQIQQLSQMQSQYLPKDEASNQFDQQLLNQIYLSLFKLQQPLPMEDKARQSMLPNQPIPSFQPLLSNLAGFGNSNQMIPPQIFSGDLPQAKSTLPALGGNSPPFNNLNPIPQTLQQLNQLKQQQKQQQMKPLSQLQQPIRQFAPLSSTSIPLGQLQQTQPQQQQQISLISKQNQQILQQPLHPQQQPQLASSLQAQKQIQQKAPQVMNPDIPLPSNDQLQQLQQFIALSGQQNPNLSQSAKLDMGLPPQLQQQPPTQYSKQQYPLQMPEIQEQKYLHPQQEQSLPTSQQTQPSQLQNNMLVNFYNSYSLYVNETQNIDLNLDRVLDKFIEKTQKLKPPNTQSQRIQELWQFLLEMNKSSIDSLQQKLQKTPDKVLYEAVQAIEKLNIRLMLEYNLEVNRGKQLKIIQNESLEQTKKA